MKKLIFGIIAILLMPTTGYQVSGQMSVFINEVELNPFGDDGNQNVIEWVELYNSSDSSVDVGGWTISSTVTGTVISIEEGTMILPENYLPIGRGSEWLDNSEEIVVLRDSEGRIIDSVGPFSDDADDPLTWQRSPDGNDNWLYEFNTPASANAEQVLGLALEPTLPTQKPTSIHISLSNQVYLGDSLEVVVTIEPPHPNTSVSLEFLKPSRERLELSATTDSSGKAILDLEPDLIGKWRVQAKWQGDDDHSAASSEQISFAVDERPPLGLAKPSEPLKPLKVLGKQLKNGITMILVKNTRDLDIHGLFISVGSGTIERVKTPKGWEEFTETENSVVRGFVSDSDPIIPNKAKIFRLKASSSSPLLNFAWQAYDKSGNVLESGTLEIKNKYIWQLK